MAIEKNNSKQRWLHYLMRITVDIKFKVNAKIGGKPTILI